MADKKNLLLLFERPQEPLFLPRGENNTVFKLPEKFLPDNYKDVTLANRFGGENPVVEIKEITIPDITDCLKVERNENFSLFIPKHSKCAGQLIDIFMGCKDVSELQNTAAFCRERVNPYLFNYAYTVALLHRKDTSDIDVPTLVNFFPDKFVDPQVLGQCRAEVTTKEEGERKPIEIPVDYTASNLEPEHRLAYWREDLGINLHHWHWHLVFPFDSENREIVAKNRRGELFYYMHQQIIARYNVERFCNQMARVRRFNNWREQVPEAYFPKLDSLVANRAYPARSANQMIQDINRPVDQLIFDIDDLYRWRDRIYAAIHSGAVNDDTGKRIELTENEGIDILGDILEASMLSPNRAFYGNLHNLLHVALSYIHDPDHRHLEQFSTVGDSTTAMRDPIFYALHAFIDDVFQEFKATLPRYNPSQLDYQGVRVTSAKVLSSSKENELNTFWQQSDIDMSRGLDFQARGSILVRFTHLQHRPFSYQINVNNSGAARQGTCRIFMAPKFDERGNPWLLRDQRTLFVEMDRFTVSLNPGDNVIKRNSSESSVTIPFERTFRNLETNRPTGGDALEAFNLCGCGWPEHMLLPKGTPEGYTCELFVMISNYENDKVEQNIDGVCTNGSSFCGLKDKLYPDRRSMGYPFDRVPRDGVNSLIQFLTPNMLVQDIVIRHTNQILNLKK